MEFVLDNGSIRVALSTAGGSFTSIAANGREYLWQGDPAVWSGQAPICFPICGGLRDGRAMTMGGREVKLARHGFARKQEWKLEEQSDSMVALSLSSADHAELLEQYPYPFKIVARYTIDSEKVAVSYEVTNEGTVWSTAAQGFAGPVAVQVTLDGLTIKSIKIGDDQFAETDGLGANALDPMFQLQFVDKTLPLAEGDVEAISGATITTDAVLTALNAIYEAAK